MTPEEREQIIESLYDTTSEYAARAIEVIESLSSELRELRLPVGDRNTREIVEKWAQDMYGRKPTWAEVNLCNRVAAALTARTEAEAARTPRQDFVKALMDYLEACEHGTLDPAAAKARFVQLLERA